MEGFGMSRFRVKFFNTLLGSDGHPHKVLQRTIDLQEPKTAKDAVELAKRDFECLECVPDWHLHAQCCEVEAKGENFTAVEDASR
jgi:hypothetical protein